MLIKNNIILEVLSRGTTKCLVMAKLPSSETVRRVDFLYTTVEQFPFAILYFTGSKIFNTVMRHIALEKGYTMNEHGLNRMVEKKKGDKVLHSFKNEEDIFNFLGLVYKSPTERTDGRAVIKKKLKIHNDDESVSDDNNSKNILQNAVKQFKINGISVLKKLNENQLSFILREANKAYFNEQPFITDNEYDIIKEYIEQNYPSNTSIAKIGAQVQRNKVTLPYPMGSMDKIKPDTRLLSNWK